MDHFSCSPRYADAMLMIFNINCGAGEAVFFNITRQNLQPRNCGEPPVYVTNIKHIRVYTIAYLTTPHAMDTISLMSQVSHI